MVNNEDFNTLFEKHRGIIYNASKTFIKYMTEEELLSCQLIGLMDAINNFDKNKAKLTTYIGTKVYYECLNFYRKEKKKDINQLCQTPEDKSFPITKRIELLDSIDSLEDKYSDVLKKRFFEKMTLQEIADSNNYSHETARKNIKKALFLLKEAV